MSFVEFDKVKNKKIPCVHCGKKAATRVILTSPGIEFRGDGFYSTDNKKDSEHKVVELTNQ